MLNPLLPFLFFALLISCASNNAFESNTIAISTVPVGTHTTLDVRNIWPLKLHGTYLQNITTTIHQDNRTQPALSVYLTLSSHKIDAIAFNDVAGRLYQLTATPGQIAWTRSQHVPAMLKPENIIADFLLTNLPLNRLQKVLQGATANDNITPQGKVRTIQNKCGVLRNITYTRSLGQLWQHIIIDNPALGYTLNIETVQQ